MTVNSGTTLEVFAAFVEQVLIPRLHVGDIVVMDNLATHKKKAILSSLEAAGVTVVYTPHTLLSFTLFKKHDQKLSLFSNAPRL